MGRFSLIGLLLAVVASPVTLPQKVDKEAKHGTAPLLYTIRNNAGSAGQTSRTSRDRKSVLNTVKMTNKQIEEWVEASDPMALSEARSATFERGPYEETISRGEGNVLLYMLLDGAGTRTSRDRDSVRKTVGWTADKVKVWVKAEDGKDQLRAFIPGAGMATDKVIVLIADEKGGRQSTDEASSIKALKMSEGDAIEWVKDEKSIDQMRAATFVRTGYAETVWRVDGVLMYTVRNEKWSLTSRNRESALKTIKMTAEQAQEWAEAGDDKAVNERRMASFYRKDYLETIARGPVFEAPYLRPE